MNYFTLAYYIIIATIIGVPCIFSLYVLVTPTHKLVEAWQLFRMRRTTRVLKDKHFRRLPRTIKLCKLLSLVVFVATVWAILWQLKVDFWSWF